VTLGTSKETTPSISKTLNPEWKTCFEMPLGEVPLVECICWDKDRWGKDYMGEFDIAVEDIFADGKLYQEVRQVYCVTNSTIADMWVCSPNGIN
jgi:phosphatidylserine decarboxylase